MPAEYRCDGACRRLLSTLKTGNVTEGALQYCAEDYQRLVAARAGYKATVQTAVDNAQSLFTHLLGDFITAPLFNATDLQALSDKVKKDPTFVPIP